MNRFLEWFNNISGDDPDLDCILKAGIAHLWFLTIHPFEAGNGRIGRAICDLAIARTEKTRQRFCSMSAQIEQNKKRYYDVLELTQRGDMLEAPRVDMTRYLLCFIDCYAETIEIARSTTMAVIERAKFWRSHPSETFSETQRTVVKRLLEGFVGNVTIKKYMQICKCSQQVSIRDIEDMVRRGLFVRSSSKKEAYSFEMNL